MGYPPRLALLFRKRDRGAYEKTHSLGFLSTPAHGSRGRSLTLPRYGSESLRIPRRRYALEVRIQQLRAPGRNRSVQNREHPHLQCRHQALGKASGEVIGVPIHDHVFLDSPANFPLAEPVGYFEEVNIRQATRAGFFGLEYSGVQRCGFSHLTQDSHSEYR